MTPAEIIAGLRGLNIVFAAIMKQVKNEWDTMTPEQQAAIRQHAGQSDMAIEDRIRRAEEALAAQDD